MTRPTGNPKGRPRTGRMALLKVRVPGEMLERLRSGPETLASRVRRILESGYVDATPAPPSEAPEGLTPTHPPNPQPEPPPAQS